MSWIVYHNNRNYVRITVSIYLFAQVEAIAEYRDILAQVHTEVSMTERTPTEWNPDAWNSFRLSVGFFDGEMG